MQNQSLGGLINRERAEDILQPYMTVLNNCIDGGWNAWRNDYADKHHILNARARAAIVFCEITHRAQMEFSAMPRDQSRLPPKLIDGFYRR